MGAAIRNLALVHLERRPQDAAPVLDRCSAGEVTALLGGAAPATSARVLAAASPRLASRCLDELPAASRDAVLAQFTALAAAAILRLRPREAREELLFGVPAEVAVPIRSALSYPEGSAGALAAPDVLTFFEETTVEQAIESGRAHRNRLPDKVLVLDRSRRIRGALRTPDLLFASLEATVGSLALEAVRAVPATTPVANLGEDRRRDSAFVPVVDRSGALLGVLRSAALRHAVRQSPAGSTTDFVAAFSELVWFALTGLLEALTGGLLSPPGSSKAGRRSA